MPETHIEQRAAEHKASYRVQKTLKSAIVFKGVGLHCGDKVKIRLNPAPANHGIIFQRADLVPAARVFAHYDAVISTQLATSLGYHDNPQVRIATVEHLLSAIFAMGITNLLIEVWGSEIPILDGSAKPFVEAILETGVTLQPFSNPVLKVVKPIRVQTNGGVCELLPRDCLRITTSVDFAHPRIGLQTFALEVTPESFAREIGAARTFGFEKDLEKLRSNNLALGASVDNVLAFSDTEILNKEGTRYHDECVRHKLLDAIGDLSLCGSWIEGELVSFRGGHSIHLALLKALRANTGHWEMLPAEPLSVARYTRTPVMENFVRPQYLT